MVYSPGSLTIVNEILVLLWIFISDRYDCWGCTNTGVIDVV